MSWFVFVLWFSEVWCKIFVLRCNSCLCVQLDGGWCKICSETFLFHLICDSTTTTPNFGNNALKKKQNVLLTLHSRFVCNYFFSVHIDVFQYPDGNLGFLIVEEILPIIGSDSFQKTQVQNVWLTFGRGSGKRLSHLKSKRYY